MLAVRNRISNDILQEYFQDTTSLFVNKTADALDAAAASQTTNCRLGDSLDVVTKNLEVECVKVFKL